MKVTLLGAHNSETKTTKPTSILIEGIIAIDAGSLAAHLTLEAQQDLESILLTHSHFDHIKDLPTLSYNTHTYGNTKIYCSKFVKDVLLKHVFNNNIWPNFSEITPVSISFVEIEPDHDLQISGYLVRGISVHHTVPTMGYHITSPLGRSVFYTGDTAHLSPEMWAKVDPDLDVVITEVTYANDSEDQAAITMHLTPHRLQTGLENLKALGRKIPRIVVVLESIRQHEQIKKELAEVVRVTGIVITLAYEGLVLDV